MSEETSTSSNNPIVFDSSIDAEVPVVLPSAIKTVSSRITHPTSGYNPAILDKKETNNNLLSYEYLKSKEV